MTDGPLDLAALAHLLAGVTPPPRRELLCGPGVIMWLRMTTPEADPSFPWSQTPPFTGIPLIRAPELGRGEWELRENDEVAASGRLDLPEPPDFTSIPLPVSFAPPPGLPPGAFLRPVPIVLGGV